MSGTKTYRDYSHLISDLCLRGARHQKALTKWSEEAENYSWNNIFLASLALAESTTVGETK